MRAGARAVPVPVTSLCLPALVRVGCRQSRLLWQLLCRLCVQACVRACVRVHARACVRACACMCMCLCVRLGLCVMIAMQRGFIRDRINGTVRLDSSARVPPPAALPLDQLEITLRPLKRARPPVTACSGGGPGAGVATPVSPAGSAQPAQWHCRAGHRATARHSRGATAR